MPLDSQNLVSDVMYPSYGAFMKILITTDFPSGARSYPMTCPMFRRR